MPKIPLYEHTPQASGANAVRANPNMFNGVAAAGQNVGNAVAGLGKTAFNIGMEFQKKKQDAIDFSSLSTASRKMEEATLLNDEKMRSTNYKDWEPNWAKDQGLVAKEISNNFEGSDIARRKMEENLKTWQMRTSLRVKSAFTGKQIENSTAEVKKSFEFFTTTGDLTSAIAVVEDGYAKQLFTTEERNEMIAQAPVIIDTNAAISAMSDNAIAAEKSIKEKDANDEYVNYKNMDVVTRRKFINASRIAASQARTQNLDNLIGRDIDGNSATEDEIKGMIAEGLLTNAQGKSYLSAQGIGYAKEGTYAPLMEEIRKYNPNGPDPELELEKAYAKILKAGLMPSLAATARATLQSLANPKHPTNAPAVTYGRSMITEVFNKSGFNRFRGDDFDDDAERNPEEVLAAQIEQEGYQDDFDRWVAARPIPPNRSEVGEYVRKIMQGPMDERSAAWEALDAKNEASKQSTTPPAIEPTEVRLNRMGFNEGY